MDSVLDVFWNRRYQHNLVCFLESYPLRMWHGGLWSRKVRKKRLVIFAIRMCGIALALLQVFLERGILIKKTKELWSYSTLIMISSKCSYHIVRSVALSFHCFRRSGVKTLSNLGLDSKNINLRCHSSQSQSPLKRGILRLPSGIITLQLLVVLAQSRVSCHTLRWSTHFQRNSVTNGTTRAYLRA